MRPLLAIVVALVFACQVSAETVMAWKADEIWVIKNGTIVHKANLGVTAVPQLYVKNSRGELFVFGCPPPAPDQPNEPPQFDFPDDPPTPEVEPAPPLSAGPLGTLLPAAAVVAGLAAGYVATRPMRVVPVDGEDDGEPVVTDEE